MRQKTARLFSRFSKAQLAILKRLDTPVKVQDFLDYRLEYNDDISDACLSPLGVMRHRRAHCLEGAMFAAAAFLFHGRVPLLLDLKADDSDDDHVIAPFLAGGRWGAVAQSHFCGLRFREPIYQSAAELAKSYFEFYYNDEGRKTLRAFSAPFSAAALKGDWLCGPDISSVGVKLDALRHYGLLRTRQNEDLRRADSLLFESEMLGAGKKPLTSRRARPYSQIAPSLKL